MADQKTNNLNDSKSNTYTKGLNKDYNDSYIPEGVWTNAINAVTASHLGDAGTIGNEPSNLFCAATNFDVIGLVKRTADTWVVFSTNDITSEIGILNEVSCEYTRLISSSCLGFKRSNLISGAIQENYDCTYTVFFADGLNPDRAINLDRIPLLIEKYTGTQDCPIPVYYDPPKLDCDLTRLHYLIDLPCFELVNSNSAGTLFNGSYQVAIAYSIAGQRITNYSLSNAVSIWTHENNGGSLDLQFSVLDETFQEYEVVLISTINETTIARRIGFYSTVQKLVHIDKNTDALVPIPVEDIPVTQIIYETSDKMFNLNSYLIRTGVRGKYDFNYQPYANQIVTKWVQVEYPADHYVKGNNTTGYLRDEIYSFFIRWVYKTGDKSASYHIPGRPIRTGLDTINVSGPDVLSYDNNGQTSAPQWRVYNTAVITGGSGTVPNGGVIRNKGYMSYWESSERYPVKPSIWNASFYPWSNITSNPPYPWSSQVVPTPPAEPYYPDYDLCGVPIRHHKFPDDAIAPIYNDTNKTIQILGVTFENIKPPVDQDGEVVRSIVGFEILRGSREGNKTIIAKGLINNMYEYGVPNQPTARALYQNYPYNCLENDYFLRSGAWYVPPGPQDHNDYGQPMTQYRKDYFTFHGPDFNFRGTYLNPSEIKIYNQYYGNSNGSFVQPYGHPKHKIPSQGAFIGCLLLGLGSAITALLGKKTTVKGNNRSLSGALTTATVAGAGAPGGTASAAAASTLGGTAFGGIAPGAGTAGGSFLSLPQMTSESNDINILNPNARKPGILAEIMSFITQLNLIITIGGFLLAQGFGNAMKLIMELLPWRQYALQYNSHGQYTLTVAPQKNNIRRAVNTARYVTSSVQTYDKDFLVNNLYRPNTVVFNTTGTIANPSKIDQSRRTVNQLKIWENPTQPQTLQISSYYAGFKLDFKGVYGQLGSIVQLPISNCVKLIQPVKNKPYMSDVYFNGDIYINRYTEKNKFPMFNQWLFDMPDGTDFDYRLYGNVPYPRYWSTFEGIDFNDISINTSAFPKLNQNAIKFVTDFANKFKNFLTKPVETITSWVVGPSKLFHLDRNPSAYTGLLRNILKKTFYIKNGYFYLFVNGVRDFYCESEINLAYRDYGTLMSEQFYNPYGFSDLYELFRTDLISVPEFYKYDFSLSVSKLAASYVSWGSVLGPSYDPLVESTCFEYYPNRMVYSLQQQFEQARDNWRIFLANNYNDFTSVITNVKTINRTGAVILFEDEVPTTINGVDELRTSAGNRITIGDAGLFNQSFQQLVNADPELEYGSCQSSRSVVNTPYGVFWVSQKTGKIMQLAGNQINDISMNGMRYWFIENFKYNLLNTFPDYDLIDNPVKGIGCQAVYDNQYELLYITKKDYKLLPGIIPGPIGPELPGEIEYIPEKKAFMVVSYSYDFKLTYGASGNYDIKSKYQIVGTVNGVQIPVCTYFTTGPNSGITVFTNCLKQALLAIPNIKNVFISTTTTSFKVRIELNDPKDPMVFDLDIRNTISGEIVGTVNVNEEDRAIIDPSDPNYFEDCSWTISYDPKIKMWLSFHDWHPNLVASSNDHFLTIKDNEFWKHNVICNSYCNFYGVNYGWEVEFPVNTGTTVTTIKSVEYYLEVFKYNMNCYDRYHVLDGNFDQAIIYNTEQMSGILNLHVKPKSNPTELLKYPEITPIGINIHVAKEENKYRFNQFWDAVKNRGEMDGLQITNFITQCNGYRKDVNPQAVNYYKSPLERKKFRHYGNRLVLRKTRSGDEKMNLKVVTTKETLSPR